MRARTLAIVYLLPILLTVTLMVVRAKFSFHFYACIGCSVVALATLVWLSVPLISLSDIASNGESVIYSRAFILASLSVVLVCAIPHFAGWRFFQPLVGFLSAFLWLRLYVWEF